MSVLGELLVEINGDNSGLNKTLNQSAGTTDSIVDFMVKKVALAAIAWKAVDLAMQGIDYNKAKEQAQIAFGVFLGGAEAAANMIRELQKVAVETPLEFADVRDAGKQLLAYGVSADKVIPTIRTLTDVSAGLNIPIKDLAYLYGTIKTTGRAATVDLNQFAGRGIPIWEELAKVTGKTGVELRKVVEAGQIGFPEIEKAFQNMTSSGGKFFQMAVKQMDSLAGAQSNFNDALDVFLGHVTEGATGPLKDMSNWAAGFLNSLVAIDKEYTKLNQDANNWLEELFGVKAQSESIFQYWKDLAGHISNDDAKQRKFAETAEKLSLEYPAAYARNNKDIQKTIDDLTGKYGLTEQAVKDILLQTRAVDDKTKALIKSGLDLNAKAVDYGDRIKYANSLQGEAVAKALELKGISSEYNKQWEAFSKKVKDHQLSEEDRLKGQIKLRDDQIDRLRALADVGTISNREAEIEIARLKGLNEANLKVLAKMAQAVGTVYDEYTPLTKEQAEYLESVKEVPPAFSLVVDGIVIAKEEQKKLTAYTGEWLKDTGDVNYEQIAVDIGAAGDAFASLSKSAAKFEQESLAKILDDMAEIAKDAQSFADGLADLAKSGGKDVGAWIAVISSSIALVADAWNMFWGGQSEAQKKASEEARKAEEERIAAVNALQNEYQAKFDSDIVRLQKERDERVAYARRIGADVLQIEAYYAGEIEKVRRTTADISLESGAVEAQKAAIKKKYDTLIAIEIAAARNAALKTKTRSEFNDRELTIEEAIADSKRRWGENADVKYIKDLQARITSITSDLSKVAVDALTEQMREELSTVVFQMQLFQERAQGAAKGIGDALANGLKEGVSAADFRTTIMDMLRDMAIDAAIIASGFQEQFNSIGVMIAEAMKDGFDPDGKELDSISKAIDDLYSKAQTAIKPINDLFENRTAPVTVPESGSGSGLNIPSASNVIPFRAMPATGASAPAGGAALAGAGSNVTHINIQSNAPLDPLQTARLIKQNQESLAFGGPS